MTKQSRYLGTSVSKSIYEIVTDRAKKENLSKSGFVRKCIKNHLSNLNLEIKDTSVKTFIENHIELEEGYWERKQNVYQKYADWCYRQNVPPISLQKFVRTCQGDPYLFKEFHPVQDGKQVTAWKNIKLKE